ncbi:MAG: gamma-glutamylcyclotransferase [Hyphomicrobiaceae bacterium]|nr:gamma-glutamylcyclotransferase [Hyphomicrobiaceae bacterium]MCC0023861.1 gamma-glutamylcyclotransferase [Hyphomicrobiaceae bacterium]
MTVDRNAMALTAELAALIERTEPDPGPEPGSRDFTDEEFEAMACDFVASRPDGPTWLFAYGSLIWNPEIDTLAYRPARALGWHRSFCLKLTRWRGTRERPALMLALDRGGSCKGLVYQLPDADPVAEMVALLKREIDASPPTNVPRWITVDAGGTPMKALAFVADPSGPAYAGRLPLEEVAHITARAAGHWGAAATYLQRTVEQLEKHGFRDRNLWVLQAAVAREIHAMHPATKDT